MSQSTQIFECLEKNPASNNPAIIVSLLETMAAPVIRRKEA